MCTLVYVIINHLSLQYTWCSQVFTDALDLLSVMFSQSLEGLDPPLSRPLQAAMQGETASLTTLTDARQVIEPWEGQPACYLPVSVLTNSWL